MLKSSNQAPFGLIVTILMSFSLAACASPSRRHALPVPRAEQSAAPQSRPTVTYPPTEYTVSLLSPQTQTATISMTIRGVRGPTIYVAVPVWRPGRYQVLDQAGSLSSIAVRGAHGQPLPFTKIDKATWRIDTAGSDRVTFAYRFYANSLNDRTRHIDDTHAFLSPAAIFVYSPDRRFAPVRVSIEAPDGWRTSTGMDPELGSSNTFTAPDYDVLVDCPLEIGIHDRHEFEVDGIPHEIIVWHAGTAHTSKPAYDPEKFKRDFAAIVRVQRDIFGDMPYARYVFQVHSGTGLGGGTEHLNSTIMQTSRATFEDDAAYKRFLGLVSHEMFHTWNVKQLRPADLKPYAFAHEDYTRLLWLVEGTTSYYDDLCLVRAGLMEPDRFIDIIESMINTELARPGWHEQSLEESSFDAWIKFNKATPDAVNSTVSFYSKGALVSLLLDMEVRSCTAHRPAGAASLDDVMRTLYTRFPLSGPGYTTQDVLDVLREVTGTPFDDFFARYIAGTDVPDFTRVFEIVGLTCEKSTDDTKPYLGLSIIEKEGKTLVAAALADGPAYRAGIMSDDEIVALDGRRVRKDDLDTRLKSHKPGDSVTFSFFRRDELRSIQLTLDSAPAPTWTVTESPSPTDQQRQAFNAWLGQRK